MATVMVPTMRAQVDANPRGSATKHVTMAAANPFERKVTRLRASNQRRDMLPGMGHGLGDFWDDFSSGFTGDGGSTDGGSTGGGVWGKLTGQLVESIGIPLLQEELLPKPEDQRLQTTQSTRLQSSGSQAIPSTQSAPMPTERMYVMPTALPPPQSPEGGGFGRYAPWLLLGGGAIVAAAIVMHKKGGSRRRRR